MLIEYKKELHEDPKGWTKKYVRFRNIDPNKAMAEPCCDGMDKALSYGFIEVKHDNRNRIDLTYDERQKDIEAPIICLSTIEPGETFDDNEERYLPINVCPFCREEIKYECLETKQIIHKCKKETKTEEVCTPYTEEKIIG